MSPEEITRLRKKYDTMLPGDIMNKKQAAKHYNKMVRDLMFNVVMEGEPLWAGIDWAKDSGMNRGDIISSQGNVVEVRFKTV